MKKMTEEVVNDLLGFEGLKIIQRPDMLNFSIDSILVADFVHITSRIKTVVDVGTGLAPIPLFLSAMNRNVHIYGFEIQEEVAEIAKRSVLRNSLEDRIDIIVSDFNDALDYLKPTSVDLIVSNPPFFKYKNDSNVSSNEYKKLARHEVTIDMEGIIQQSKRLLKDKGRLVFIHRVERLEEIMLLLNRHQFSVKRMRFIHPRVNRSAYMVLFDAANNSRGATEVLPPLYVHEKDSEHYSEEVLRMFRRR